MSSFLGFSFHGTSDIQKEDNKDFSLLPVGRYKSFIKDVAIDKTSKGTPKLIIYYQLEDENRAITADYFFPDKNAKTGDFKLDTLKNLFSRVLYSSLNYKEFKQLSNEEVNQACDLMDSIKMIQSKFTSKKITLLIDQKPFIHNKKVLNNITNTMSYEVQFTNLDFDSTFEKAPVKIKNLFKEKRYDKFPRLLFTNEVSMQSLGFYKDFEEKDKKDSVSKIFYDNLMTQSISNTLNNNEDDEI